MEAIPSNQKSDSIMAGVGNRIRGWRRQRGLTLDVLADTTGISKSYLSKLESGKKAPSIATVMKLSEALGVSVGAIFGEQNQETDIHVVRSGHHDKLLHGTEVGATYIPLSQNTAFQNLESFLYFPPSEYADDNRAEHSGEEMIYVIDGSVEVQFNDRTVELFQGDYLQFHGYNSHQIRKIGSDARLLIIINRT
ncbi:helix-turn-helix domain-containing protein [Ensifer canadensis]|uniref:helix-turn-helix domain-containing protein n=1 Tax=Ensifer canadensis TaxID=555315 RepID=UPI0035E3DE3D